MGSGAEEALTALARDLVEEIAAGRAMEIASDPDQLELASFQVKAFHRDQRTKAGQVIPEEVRAHTASRDALAHPGNLGQLGPLGSLHYVHGQPGHMIHDTSEAKWTANQWKDVDRTRNATSEKNPAGALFFQHGKDVDTHLARAQDHLGNGKLPDAYTELHEAHRAGVEQVLPRAHEPEQADAVHAQLDRIAKHMQAIDTHAGTSPEQTKRLLGSAADKNRRAGDIKTAAKTGAERAAEAGNEQVHAQHVASGLLDQPTATATGKTLVAAVAEREQAKLPLPAGPEPRKGAAAIFTNVGLHAQRMHGETFSRHELQGRAIPGPAQVAETHPDTARLEKATARLDQFSKDAETQRSQALRDHVKAMRAVAAERAGQPAAGEYAPLTDEQYAAHTRQVEEKVNQALREGKSTADKYSFDGGYSWVPERDLVHKQILTDYLDKQVSVPSARQALIMGGLGGAGKSTTLRQVPDINLKDYAVINPDDFKEELARRGMVPEVPGLAPLEASALIHDESSYLADQAARTLQERGKNIAYDITMSSTAGTERRLNELKNAGYDTSGIFVDIPVEKSVERALSRHRNGLEAWRRGETTTVRGQKQQPLGGRYVSPDLIRAQEVAPGLTRNRQAFEELKPRFSAWQLWDNSGPKPRPLERSQPAAAPGIASVEELRKQLSQPYVGNTEAQARAAELGTNKEIQRLAAMQPVSPVTEKADPNFPGGAGHIVQ